MFFLAELSESNGDVESRTRNFEAEHTRTQSERNVSVHSRKVRSRTLGSTVFLSDRIKQLLAVSEQTHSRIHRRLELHARGKHETGKRNDREPSISFRLIKFFPQIGNEIEREKARGTFNQFGIFIPPRSSSPYLQPYSLYIYSIYIYFFSIFLSNVSLRSFHYFQS